MPNPRQRDFDADFVRRVLDYDPETGLFRWRYRPDRPKKWNTRWAGKVAGTRNKYTGYIAIQLGGKVNHAAHRLAWLHYYGDWPPNDVDHRDTTRDHNWISNLRLSDNAQNMQNRAGLQSNNTSGFLGVYFCRQRMKWCARVNAHGKCHYVGFFDTPEAAGAAREMAANRLHGEFACKKTVA